MQRVKTNATAARIINGVGQQVININQQAGQQHAVADQPIFPVEGQRRQKWHQKM